jgi:hypothetical protein
METIVMANHWSQEKESAAFHEAGHRVMAALEKAPPSDVHLQWKKNENVWEGNVAGYPSSLGGATLIRIAYAGPWAEIKYQARLLPRQLSFALMPLQALPLEE